jgi:hypothetical protein
MFPPLADPPGHYLAPAIYPKLRWSLGLEGQTS